MKREKRQKSELLHEKCSVLYLGEEGETNVLRQEISKTGEGGRSHLKLLAIYLTLIIYLDRQCASFLLKPTITLSSSSCLFHVIFSLTLSR